MVGWVARCTATSRRKSRSQKETNDYYLPALKHAGQGEGNALAVREAIILGQYKFVEADQRFPKKIWFRADGRIWYGFCINTQSGQYKGWPIDEEERRAVFG